MKQLEVLDHLHPDIIASFLTTGKSAGIPADVQVFLKQLQWAAEVYEYERNISRASRQLRQRIAAEQGIALDERTCKARIYAAINYFNIDNNVSVKVWENNYADKYEDLAKLCILSGDNKTASKCYARALDCRRRAAELRPEDLGYTKASLKEIAAKHNRGFYLNLIDNLPIESQEKKRLLRDADIEEAEYEEINEE